MRKALVERVTRETSIRVELALDSRRSYSIATTIPFVDHMLTLMSHHGHFSLQVKASGDTEVDYHHLMEDLGITLGQAINKALGDKKGIRRFGFSKVPMDETLAEVVIDLSGRPYLVYRVPEVEGSLKDLPASLFEDFFRALSTHGMMNLHINVHYGRDLHHIFEAVFKAFGRALKEAVGIESRSIPSTKGRL